MSPKLPVKKDYVIQIGGGPGVRWLAHFEGESDGDVDGTPPSTTDVNEALRTESFSDIRSILKDVSKRFPSNEFRVDVAEPIEESQMDQDDQAPRFVASSGWEHIFSGRKKDLTRWIYDRKTESLVAAQGWGDRKPCGRWIDLNSNNRSDLLQSIHDNEAIDDVEDFGLVEFEVMPSWEQVEAAASAESSVEAHRG